MLKILIRSTLLCLAIFPATAANSSSGFKDIRIANSELVVGSCVRNAGAVCSIVYKGVEIVNSTDHGRELQVAWQYNDLIEGYNPTEAGSVTDDIKPLSTSRLLSLRRIMNTITSRSNPAYWLPPKAGANTESVTNDLLTKKITLGWKGDPNVIAMDISVAISPKLTGPPITSIRIEAPTIYATGIFTDHYVLDTRTAMLSKSPVKAGNKDILNETFSQIVNMGTVPIISSTDGKYAIGMYTDHRKGFWSYYTWGVPSDTPGKACNKATVFFKHPAQPGKTYSYRSFLAVGSLKSVVKSLTGLVRNRSKK